MKKIFFILSLSITCCMPSICKSHSSYSNTCYLAPKSEISHNLTARVPQIVESVAYNLRSVKSGDSVYFIASGDGKYIEEALKYLPKDINIYIFDISQEMLDKAKKRLSDRPNAKYVLADVHELSQIATLHSLPEADALFCFDALHNFTSPEKAMWQMANVVKPGKPSVINFPAALYTQPLPYVEFLLLAKEIEKQFVKDTKHRIPITTKKKFYAVIEEYRINDMLRQSFNCSVSYQEVEILISLEELIEMFDEFMDYKERLFTRTKQESVNELFRMFIAAAKEKMPSFFTRKWVNLTVVKPEENVVAPHPSQELDLAA